MTVDSVARKRSVIKPDTIVIGIDLAKHTHVARAGSVTVPTPGP